MNILQSAATLIWTFGAFLQNLVNPIPPADVRLSTNIAAEAPIQAVEQLENTDQYLLPDMQVLPPKELYITTSEGKRTLRFNTTFANVGEGPLKLTGENDRAREKTIATQHLTLREGGEEERLIGEFVFHPTHDHWHVDRYAQFQIYSFDRQRGPLEVVAQTDKYSFCIWDEHAYNLSLPNAPQTRQFPRCPRNIQGNSVGWGDTYTANVDGQEVDITGIPDGLYMVRSVVNADHTIIESDYSNNSAVLYVEMAGNSVRQVTP